MEQLYLNNILFELPEGSIALTLQVNDIGEVKNRQAGYTNSILIPETPGNLLGLEMLGVTGNKSKKPYQKIQAKYIVDEQELVSNGYAIINETDKGFKVHIYDGNMELYSVIGDQDLNSLDWSSLNHSLSIPTIQASLQNTEGYIYADGIFYDEEYSTDLNFKSPSIFAHTIFKMILEQNGYSYSGDIFNDPKFNNLVVSTKRGYDNTLNFTELQYFSDNWSKLINVRRPNSFEESVELGSIVCQNHEIHRLVIDANMTIDEGVAAIDVKKNGVPFYTQVVSENLTLDTSFLANENDVISIDLRYTGVFDGVEYVAFMDIVGTVQLFGSSANPIAIDFSIMFDEEKQVTFFKEIMQQFGLIHRQKRNSKEIQFIAIKDLLRDRATAEDWSDKLSKLGKESYKHNFERENNFCFKYDSLPFADGALFVDNENLSGVKSVMNSIFTASPTIDGYEAIDHWGVSDDLLLPKVSKFKLYNLTFSESSLSISYPNVFGANTITGQIPKLEQVYFENVLKDNYSEYNSLLNGFKNVESLFNLSSSDIYGLDFFKLKYLQQTGKYYYLNRVPGYVRGQKTKVELIEVPNEFALISNFKSSGNTFKDGVVDNTAYSGTGAQGTQGVQGAQGARGYQGYQGFQGAAGVQGANGAQGYQGFQGLRGYQGYQGLTGAKGLDGIDGSDGAQGATGAQGAQGAQGSIGLTGAKGNQGDQGSQGSTGATGVDGLAGPQGFQGIQGATGAQGVRGYQGYQGAQGAVGLTGATGAQGNQGNQGATGATGATGLSGPQGFQGVQGATGAQGAKGATGATGAQGAIGLTGATGAQGNQGNQGATGATGATGLSGPQGFQGATGATGAQGARGYQGYTGAQGSIGLTGARGDQGVQGAQGSTGATGATGLSGPQGVRGYQGYQGYQGAKGATGATGAQGAIGLTGATGAQGNQGNQGATGATGATGLSGPQGFQGATGATGAQGARGYQGYTGAQGSIGLTGAKGDQGVQGAQGSTGATGATGLSGPQGVRGYQGYQGYQGAKGATGATGAQGAIGLTGATGAQGARGYQGYTGATGPTGLSGPQGVRGYQGYQGATGTVNVSSGTGTPSGGSSGDIYYQYE